MNKKNAPIAPFVLKKKDTASKLSSGMIVFQHNNLVEAKYHLTLQEKRLILWLISQIKPTDEDFKNHILDVKDFMNIAGLTGHANYDELEKITLNLIKKALIIKNQELNTVTQVAWLCSARYEKNQGRVFLSFAPEMKPFLLNLKSRFTAIELTDVMQFTSVHAIRIYELLKQYENVGERVMTIDEIKSYCGVKSHLNQYIHFESRILLIAQREINNKSDIKFTFEKIKHGRKIESIRFLISKNMVYEILQEPQKLENASVLVPVFYQLKDFGLTRKVIEKILAENSESDVRKAIQAIDVQITKGKVRNPKAILITAIKEKWTPEQYFKR